MGMGAGGSSGGPNSAINVTPLVDVCLVLLIIFMVMTPRNVPELSVRIPPETKSRRPQPPGEGPLVVGLNKDGAITLNTKSLLREDLGKEITRQLDFREKKAVFVNFDHDANYGDALVVMDIVKKGGAEVVGIMRDKDYKVPDTLK